ncbi:MAG: hemerythrin domain-containing protein [Pseudomonadota bacterium]|nr:hemerythrin domain-containing protein [Pseudomonadota bacterium]
MDAIDIIRSEHARIDAVLGCLDRLSADMARGETVPDLTAFDAILDYMQSFPERFHHPKESEYLFTAVVARAPELDPVIGRLEGDHDDGEERLTGLSRSLERVRAGEAGAVGDFREDVAGYVAFERDHMRTEEKMILSRARDVLDAASMQTLTDAFTGHTDPLFGENRQARFRTLYSKLLDVIPTPDGFGRPWERKPVPRDHAA